MAPERGEKEVIMDKREFKKQLPIDTIQKALQDVMDEDYLNRYDIANMMRVHVSYINMLFSKSWQRVPGYVTAMLSEWIQTGKEFKEWFMEKCDFSKYEATRRSPRSTSQPMLRVKDEALKKRKAELAAQKTKAPEPEKPKEIQWVGFDEKIIPMTKFINELINQGLHPELTITVKL